MLLPEDHLVGWMVEQDIAVSRETYLREAFPPETPDWRRPLHPELEAELPEELQLDFEDE